MVKYSDEQKEAALHRINEVGITHAAKELHIADQTLRKWRNNAALTKQKEEQFPVEAAMDRPAASLSEQEPPVVKIETIIPDPTEVKQGSGKGNQKSTEKEADPVFEIGPSTQDDLMRQLMSENTELKLRINLLKKSLIGIVEAVASL